MLQIGEGLVSDNLYKWGPGGSAPNIAVSDYDDDITLLSFIDFNDTDCMEWLECLINLQGIGISSLSIIAVFFTKSGSIVDGNDLQDKIDTQFGIGTYNTNNIPITIFIDNKTWGNNPLTRQYANEGFNNDGSFSDALDGANNLFSGIDSLFFLFYFNKLTDKWNSLSASKLDPISFNQLGQYKAILTVTGYAVGNTPSVSLNSDIFTDPLNGTNSISITAAGNVNVTIEDPRIQSIIPAGGTITSLTSIIITFSEDCPNAAFPAYYTIILNGVTAISPEYQNRDDFDSADFDNTEMYLSERLNNLQHNPAILRYSPIKNTDVSADPIDQPVNIVFSKPINVPAETNYPVAGSGFTALTDANDTDGNGIKDSTFSYNTIENNAQLTLYGEIASGASDDPVTITLSDITDTDSSPNPLAGQDVISYIANDAASPVSHDIVIVLDYSGSMGSSVNIIKNSLTVSERKIDILENAVEEFVNLKTEFPVTGDNVSLIKFYNSSVQTTIDGINYISGDPNNITNFLNGNAGGLTPLGGALYRALEKQDAYQIANPASKKAIIVFTDGIQNMNPSIYDTGGGDAYIGPYSGSHSWGYGGSPCNVSVSTPWHITGDYPIFTIGVGMTNDSMFQQMLKGISNASDGDLDASLQEHTHFSFLPNSMWPGTNSAFSDFLQTIYYGNSPQVICKTEGVYHPGTPSIIEFIVNRSVKKLVLSLSWLKNNPLCLKISKDGTEVIIANYTIIKNDAFGIASIDFTSEGVLWYFPDEADKEGTWQAEIIPGPGVNSAVMYHLVVLGDEEVIQVDFDEPSLASTDLIQPAIDRQFTDISQDNSLIIITFTEEVYSNSNASGPLTAGDFQVTFSPNNGTAANVSITGVTHTEGTMTAILHLNVAGIPNGMESMVISPKINSIFDAAGNAALPTANTGDILLFDRLPPSVAASSVSADNSSLTIEFSEGVLSTPNGAGCLDTGDFTLIFNQNGGSAGGVLISGVIHTAGSQFVTLNLTVAGNPDGNEKIRINMNSNSVFDASGNACQDSLYTNWMNLNDMKNPVIAQAILGSDNRTLRLNFSEGVYSKNDMTGQLDKTDFNLAFSPNGGTATSVSIDTAIHTPGSDTVIFNLAITGTPDGKETVTISPKSDSVFDAAGNKAQANDSAAVSLFDKNPPAVKSWSLEHNNNYVRTVFSENVFSTSSGTEALKPEDFTLKFEKNGGSAANAVISAVLHSVGADSAKLLLNINGIPDGKEKITVSPKDNSVFDIAGNAALKDSNVKTFNLHDMTFPVIMDARLSFNNKVLSLLFNEGVYAEKGCKGALDKDDFDIKFDNNGGTAKKVTITVMAHEPGSNLVEFFLEVTGDPSGDELLMIFINPKSVYDGSDNIAKSGSLKDPVYLNAKTSIDQRKPDYVYAVDPVSLGVSVKENNMPGSSIYAAVTEIERPAMSFWSVVQKNLKWIEENINKKKPVEKFSKPEKEKPEDEESLPNLLYNVMMTNKQIARDLLKKEKISIELKPESQKLRQQSLWTGGKLTETLKIRKGIQKSGSIPSIKDIQNRLKFSFHKARTVFSGNLKQAVIPGEYLITYKVKGASKESGVYERTLTKFVNVIVRPHPRYSTIFSEFDAKNNILLVTILPCDELKNQFVPGSVHKLTCILDRHERISLNNIQGNINGSYTVTIPVRGKEELEKRKLLIISESVVLFDDLLYKIKTKGKETTVKKTNSGIARKRTKNARKK